MNFEINFLEKPLEQYWPLSARFAFLLRKSMPFSNKHISNQVPIFTEIAILGCIQAIEKLLYLPCLYIGSTVVNVTRNHGIWPLTGRRDIKFNKGFQPSIRFVSFRILQIYLFWTDTSGILSLDFQSKWLFC